jgi:acyl carrier protein
MKHETGDSVQANALATASQLLAGLLMVSAEKIAPHQRLLDDLAMDSLELLELAMELEERWSICLDEDRLRRLVTVSDVAALIESAA